VYLTAAIHHVRTRSGKEKDIMQAVESLSKATGRLCAASAVALTLLAGSGKLRAQSYTITDLGTLPGESDSKAYGINNASPVQVVGASGNRAFLWTEGSGMMNLGTLPGGNYVEARAINDSGEIVGSAADASGNTHAFLWLPAPAYGLPAGMNDLGTLGGSTSHAYDIDNSGRVVGEARNSAGRTHAFRWQNGSMTDLGTLSGGLFSSAYGINASGVAVGQSAISGDIFGHAVRWSGGITDLGYLDPNGPRRAYAINGAGLIVGFSWAPDNFQHAFLWQSGSGMSDLGVSGQWSEAHAINDASPAVIVGTNAGAATLWYTDGTMVDLNTVHDGTGWNLTEAWDINDDGRIVGGGVHNGQARAFLLTPIPCQPAQVVDPPTDQTACVGDAVTMSVTATGTPPLRYQWRKDFTDIPGATGPTYVIDPVTQADAGNYDVVVTNACGSDTSWPLASLTVNVGPTIVSHPPDRTACEGGDVFFSVTASGTPPLNYQWRKDGVDIPGATSSIFVINPVSMADAGTYDVVVSNMCGSVVSNPATLTVYPGQPTITQHPADQTVCEGDDATFTVAATGTGLLHYQWRKNGSPVGGDSSTLLLIGVPLSDDGAQITCDVSDDCGTATSNPALLSVCARPSADFDDNCYVDINDLTILLQNFGATGTQRGDADGDGDVDLDDLTITLQQFGTGGCT